MWEFHYHRKIFESSCSKETFRERIVYRSRLRNQTTGNLIYWELRFASAYSLLHPFSTDKGPIFYENTVSWYVSGSKTSVSAFYISIYFSSLKYLKDDTVNCYCQQIFDCLLSGATGNCSGLGVSLLLHFIWGWRYNGRLSFVST